MLHMARANELLYPQYGSDTPQVIRSMLELQKMAHEGGERETTAPATPASTPASTPAPAGVASTGVRTKNLSITILDNHLQIISKQKVEVDENESITNLIHRYVGSSGSTIYLGKELQDNQKVNVLPDDAALTIVPGNAITLRFRGEENFTRQTRNVFDFGFIKKLLNLENFEFKFDGKTLTNTDTPVTIGIKNSAEIVLAKKA